MRRARCIVTWRISGPCAVCGELIRSSRATPGAHLGADDGPATLPTCAACCKLCQGRWGGSKNFGRESYGTALASVKNVTVPTY